MIRSIFFYGFILWMLIAASACVTVEKITDGTQAYQYKKYSKAIPMLKSELEKENDETIKAQKWYYLAESYRQTNQAQLAAQAYAQALELGYDREAMWKQVQMLKTEEKYEEASAVLKKYMTQHPDEKVAVQKELKACEDAMSWKAMKTGYVLTNLACNSAQDDFAGVLNQGYLVFTSSRESATGEEKYDWNEKKFYDLFQTRLDTKNFSTDTVSLLEAMNTDFHEGTCSYSKTGLMFYTKCGDASMEDSYCRIYMRQSNGDGTYGAEQVLNPFEETKVNCIQPFVSSDGKTLYFSSDIDAGVGGYDLYAITAQDEAWSEPQNLGSSINTEGNEFFPTLDEKNTLYFSSDTWQGMGGLDIYKATGSGKRYMIENMKSPINSGADDFGIQFLSVTTADKADSLLAKGVFSSNRTGGKGMDDLYGFIEKILPTPPVIVYEVRLHVIEKIHEDTLNPNSAVIDSQDIQLAKIQWILAGDTTLASTDGKGLDSLMIEDINEINIKVSKSGYFAQSKKVSIRKDKKYMIDHTITTDVMIVLERIHKDKEIVLDDIYYDYDSTAIRADAALVLDRVATILIENPELKIQMGSHTDCRGSATYNEKLSQGRAEKAVEYLVKKGIAATRLSAKGYGESSPIATCDCKKCTESDHQKNRRSTFKVID